MKEKYFVLVTMLLFLVPCKVCATNDVDYQLTITDDFKFKEIIRYEISDYSEKENKTDRK